ncbi:ABC transporter permease [Devosia sp. ZW T5_3]|uniref:ABC transporter permease n=1 Tax=Devosia sp. ZW T5_3 TaxID=3378085 RepID=UPI003851C388
MTLHKNDWRWVERTFWGDLRVLLGQRRLAWQLYIADIAEQRRNSGLGLFAPFISVLVHVALLGTVMSLVFRESVDTFIPFFAISMSFWQAISTFISDTAHANEKISRYISFPSVSGYIVHMVACYEFLVAVVLKVLASVVVISVVNFYALSHANIPAFIISVMLICLLLISWALPISFVFDRVRVLRGFLPQLLFAIYLITPILWNPSRIESHRWVVDYNPVFHVMEAARSPLLEGEVPLVSYAVVLGLTAIGVALSAALFGANRNLVIYRWVA